MSVVTNAMWSVCGGCGSVLDDVRKRRCSTAICWTTDPSTGPQPQCRLAVGITGNCLAVAVAVDGVSAGVRGTGARAVVDVRAAAAAAAAAAGVGVADAVAALLLRLVSVLPSVAAVWPWASAVVVVSLRVASYLLSLLALPVLVWPLSPCVPSMWGSLVLVPLLLPQCWLLSLLLSALLLPRPIT